MKKYVVVEGPLDSAIVTALVNAAGIQEVTVVIGSGKSSALSFASSIALSRHVPVAVIVDAETRDTQSILEQEQSFRDLLPKSASPRTRLFLAVPNLEEDIFPTPDTFSEILGLQLSQVEQDRFNSDRKQLLSKVFTPDAGWIEEYPADGINVNLELARDGFNNSLLKRLFDFLRRRDNPASRRAHGKRP